MVFDTPHADLIDESEELVLFTWPENKGVNLERRKLEESDFVFLFSRYISQQGKYRLISSKYYLLPPIEIQYHLASYLLDIKHSEQITQPATLLIPFDRAEPARLLQIELTADKVNVSVFDPTASKEAQPYIKQVETITQQVFKELPVVIHKDEVKEVNANTDNSFNVDRVIQKILQIFGFGFKNHPIAQVKSAKELRQEIIKVSKEKDASPCLEVKAEKRMNSERVNDSGLLIGEPSYSKIEKKSLKENTSNKENIGIATGNMLEVMSKAEKSKKADDKKLSIALQKVYLENPSIPDDIAFSQAKQNSQKACILSEHELKRLKDEEEKFKNLKEDARLAKILEKEDNTDNDYLLALQLQEEDKKTAQETEDDEALAQRLHEELNGKFAHKQIASHLSPTNSQFFSCAKEAEKPISTTPQFLV